MTFTAQERKATMLYEAFFTDPAEWQNARAVLTDGRPAAIAPDFLYKKHQVAYLGDEEIRVALLNKTKEWTVSKAMLKPRDEFFDSGPLLIGQARLIDAGIAVTYYSRREHGYAIGAALFDEKNPTKLLWRSDYPLWEQPEHWRDKHLYFIGEAETEEEFLVFWGDERGGIFSVKLAVKDYPTGLRAGRGRHPLHLKRHDKNPILKPRPQNSWESKAAFNPAAFYAADRVHLVYRAIGDSDVSVFGYASSPDGIHFDERLDEPIYVPRMPFEGANLLKAGSRPWPSSFMSGGGGWGGCEDPRISLIGETVYMTYVAFDGQNPPRVALTSISLRDFLNHNWDWKEPVLISPYLSGEGNKNACILPEKVGGKYVILHRLFPDILLDYVDDLDFDGQNKWLSGQHRIKPRPSYWDSRKVGAGATPIKTDEGWLMIYQAVGRQDPSKYKIGAMLLDKDNPEKVIARSAVPILEPEAWYENEGWKYGVVYPCGAAVVKDELFVYYGGADTFTCAAKTSLPDFLHNLIQHKPASLVPLAL